MSQNLSFAEARNFVYNKIASEHLSDIKDVLELQPDAGDIFGITSAQTTDDIITVSSQTLYLFGYGIELLNSAAGTRSGNILFNPDSGSNIYIQPFELAAGSHWSDMVVFNRYLTFAVDGILQIFTQDTMSGIITPLYKLV